MADDYATWQPQAEADWTPEDYEKLRMDRDVWQARFERLGAAGEVYMQELRSENARLRDALAAWEKFAWYASGESGNTPLLMNLWQAMLFVAAREASVAVLVPPTNEAPHE